MTKETATGTTWLMARTDGSADMWQMQPGVMAAALPYYRATMTHLVALHGGTLSERQPTCDGFTAAFDRAADAVACALSLQLTPLDPFALGIGVHTARDGAKRLCDIAGGGQTLISGPAASSVADDLPAGATLEYLGDQPMGDTEPREPLLHLCHPGLPVRPAHHLGCEVR